MMKRTPPTKTITRKIEQIINNEETSNEVTRDVGITSHPPIAVSLELDTNSKQKNDVATVSVLQTPTSTYAPSEQLTATLERVNVECAGKHPQIEETSSATVDGSPRLELIQKMRKMEEDAISQCKAVIKNMQQAINRQKNISNDVKVGISKMSELLDVALNYRCTWKTADKEWLLSKQKKKSATKQLVNIFTPAGNTKRAATSPAAPENSKKARGKEANENRAETLGDKEGNWQTVSKKGSRSVVKEKPPGTKGKSRIRPQRIKPEAVIIKPTGSHSYSEVLRNLRSKISTDDQVNVRSVRKTKTGAILLELEKGEKVRPEFVQQLKRTIQETASIAELKPRATIEIRDLDFLTQGEEVEAAVRKLLANPEEQMQTKITEPNTREQVRAFITLSAESAAKLINAGHVKIGWIRARMRACENIRRCYRCFGTGHTQSNCSGIDRKDMCIRCGKSGHKMRDCKAAPRCVHCIDAKRDRTDHLPGSTRCPLARKS